MLVATAVSVLNTHTVSFHLEHDYAVRNGGQNAHFVLNALPCSLLLFSLKELFC